MRACARKAFKAIEIMLTSAIAVRGQKIFRGDRQLSTVDNLFQRLLENLAARRFAATTGFFDRQFFVRSCFTIPECEEDFIMLFIKTFKKIIMIMTMI